MFMEYQLHHYRVAVHMSYVLLKYPVHHSHHRSYSITAIFPSLVGGGDQFLYFWATVPESKLNLPVGQAHVVLTQFSFIFAQLALRKNVATAKVLL